MFPFPLRQGLLVADLCGEVMGMTGCRVGDMNIIIIIVMHFKAFHDVVFSI